MKDLVLAVVPVKSFEEAKQRLATVLDKAGRAELSRKLLRRTIKVLKRARGVGRVAVVSRDAAALQLARDLGAWSIWESGAGLNEALEQATRVALANGVSAILIMPADLPHLKVKDVEQIVRSGQNPPAVVIAPALRDEGTNALLANPAGAIQYAFGKGSFVEHQRRAIHNGARVEIYQSETVAFDLDLPEDLEKLERGFARRQADQDS